MTPRPLRLTAFAHGSHPEVVAAARDAIGGIGGFILDFRMFSNSILVLNFEVPASKLTALVESLEAVGVPLDASSRALIDERLRTTADAQIAGALDASLSINLVNDDPPMRIEVPAVPG